MRSINRKFVLKGAANARPARDFFFAYQWSDAATEYLANDTDFAAPAREPEAEVTHVARLPEIATQRIGRRMRKMYGAILREAAPDDLLLLLRQLELKEGPY